MSRPSSSIAKLTRPHLHEAVDRGRLFARLDRGRARKFAIRIVGPPGAGKTTVVATWLDERRTPGIWYQIDAGDADLATFFYYLGEASLPFAAHAPAQSEQGGDAYLQALALATELGMRPLVAHCHFGLGKLYRQMSKREKAQEHLTTATTMYREMDMRFWLEQAEVEIRGLA